jgi:hypothetical protein
MNDSIYLERCKVLIQKKVKSDDIKNWKNKDFLHLSHEISTASKISISADTLKRVFGKLKTYKTYYNPQDETKKAMAIYLGYPDWETFKSLNNDLVHTDPDLAYRIKSIKFKRTIFFGIAGSFALGAMILFIFYNGSYPESFKFTGKNLTGYPPHTSIFGYDITRIKSDSVAIDYDWSNPMIEKLEKNGHTITTMHGEPGYYHVKLLVDNKPKSTLGVHVLTRDWESVISTFTGIRQKLDSNYISKGVLHVSDKEFKNTGIDKNLVHIVKFLNYKDFGVSGDNFEFELRAKNTKETGGQSCFDVKYEIICENGNILVLLVEPGCHKYARVQVSEVSLAGHNNDLSALGQDVSDWRTFKIRTVEKKTIIYFDKKEIYRLSYNTPLGKVKGVELSFKGRGMADFVKMYNGSKEVVFSDEFQD